MKMSVSFRKLKSFRRRVKIDQIYLIIQKKVDLKNGVHTSKSIKKFDLAKVKSEVDKLEKES